MPRKVRIEVRDTSPWGDEFDEQILTDPGKDSTYIKGFSDKFREREIAVSKGERPAPLEHRLQWANPGNLHRWLVNKHNKVLMYDDALKLGYDLKENPAITRAEDGRALLRDQVLVYADRKVAASNFHKVRENQDQEEVRARNTMAQAATNYEAKTGLRPEVFDFAGDDPEEAK